MLCDCAGFAQNSAFEQTHREKWCKQQKEGTSLENLAAKSYTPAKERSNSLECDGVVGCTTEYESRLPPRGSWD